MKFLKKIKSLDANNKIILGNTLAAFVVKGAGLIVSFLTTPAFIRYFDNKTVLGVWYTLLSVLVWFLNFDLGIGNGIRNNLVKDFAANDYDSARKTISSGLFANFIVTFVLGCVGVALISVIDLNWLYNISPAEISKKTLYLSTVFVLIAILLRFFLTTVSSIFYAIQRSSVNNALSLLVSVLQLAFVLVAKFDSPEKALIGLSISYIVISNLPVFIAGIVVFCTKLRNCLPSFKCIEKFHIKKVMGIGSVFFACQILYMLIVNTNDFLITNLFGAEYTADYNFYYKITSLISMVVTLTMTPIWSVITKAMAEKKYQWIRKLYKTIKWVGLGVILLQFLMVPCIQFIFDIWLQENSIKVNYVTAIAFACFGSVFVYSGMLSTIVCGMAKMKLQTICYVIGVIVKFLLVFGLASIVNNWSIVVWANAIILLPYCIAEQIHLNIYLKKLCKETSVENIN